MADVLVLCVMLVSGLIPFALAAKWMKAGKVGWTLSLVSVIGAGLAIAVQASTRLMGVDPIQAIGAALLVFLPAFIGSLAGGLLGWLIERRRVKTFQGK